MLQRKKVAVIGAGPSGLVTAKTLLHDYPGTFSPVVFEKRHEVGGLWPMSPKATQVRPSTSPSTNARQDDDGSTGVGTLNPSMRTNLSRFTVAFSDLAWESVFSSQVDESEGSGALVPLFPQAWQVGRYLGAYAERFLPSGVVRLGRRVVKAARKEEGQWVVQWVESDNERIKSEQFDYLVVASGYFSSPYIPDIPGLGTTKQNTIHSSSLRNADDVQRVLQTPNTSVKKVVVIGGSMSGAEAASTLALHVSSLSSSSRTEQRQSGEKDYEVHHISTRPFWTLPAYLPQEIPVPEPASGETRKKVSFVPLDLTMYDLSRRPPGPVEYTFGPISLEKAQKTNTYLSLILGGDYAQSAKVRARNEQVDKTSQPPWVAIGNDYAEYVRSHVVTSTVGRVSAVHTHTSEGGSDPGSTCLDITLPDGKTETLNNVTAIILATGFTPYHSLSYLPSSVLSTLEYSEKDPFFPLILDKKGTSHAEIPDIAFVGFYRGPYWGVMEIQARLVARNWARHDDAASEGELAEREGERQAIRDLRSVDTQLQRGQFPMGDYVGLMETSAKELGMVRKPILQTDATSGEGERRTGPVLPARYQSTTSGNHNLSHTDQITTLHSLRSLLLPQESQPGSDTHSATSMAIFRALHGSWKVTRTYHQSPEPEAGIRTVRGTAGFQPRYPTRTGYEKEYVYYEQLELEQQHQDTGSMSANTGTRANRYIYRLRAPEATASPSTPGISIWSVQDSSNTPSELQLLHGLDLETVAECGDKSMLGGYTMHAHATGSSTAEPEEISEGRPAYEYIYTFHFQGVSILSWGVTAGKVDEECLVRTVYERS